MQNFVLNDEQLKKAFGIYCDNLLLELPRDDVLQESQAFSKSFETKMQKLIQRAKLSPWQLHYQMAKRIAILLLAFTLGATALMQVDAIRIPVVRFFTEIHQTFTRIVFGAEDKAAVLPETIEQIYVPGFIPEGFNLEFELVDINFAVQTYHKENEYFELTQYCTTFALHLDTEGVTLEELTKDGITYSYFENKGIKNLIWEQNGYVFICDGTVERDALIQIAESLQKNN